MALYPQSFIDDLRLRAGIVQIVQEYVSLKRAGRVYKGLCPFHSEKTPSFQVDPDKEFFYCFGCKAGGDVFKFLELQEKVNFGEAVRMLAQKTGTSLPEPDENDPAARQDAALRESLLKMHEIAGAYFREQLALPGAARARQYLDDRAMPRAWFTANAGHWRIAWQDRQAIVEPPTALVAPKPASFEGRYDVWPNLVTAGSD